MQLEEILENEWYMVRHSGEIPEIAFNASLYYLANSPDGPKLCLTRGQIDTLRDAACARYRQIIYRDLDHEKLTDTDYRGIRRSIINYQRYRTFCERQGIVDEGFDDQLAVRLCDFLQRELEDVGRGYRKTVINCSFEELTTFCLALQVSTDNGLEQMLCPPVTEDVCRENIVGLRQSVSCSLGLPQDQIEK